MTILLIVLTLRVGRALGHLAHAVDLVYGARYSRHVVERGGGSCVVLFHVTMEEKNAEPVALRFTVHSAIGNPCVCGVERGGGLA